MNVSPKYSDGSVASRHVCRDVNGRFKPCNPDFNYQDRYGTGSVASSVRRGRRCLFGRPLTNAEKQRRWRLRHPCLCGRPASTGGLLDLPVRTDTKTLPLSYTGMGPSGSRGFKGVESDPFRMVRCEICGRPIQACRCDPGRDY